MDELKYPARGDVIRCKDDEDGCSFKREVLFVDDRKRLVYWRDFEQRPHHEPSTLSNWRKWAKGGEIVGRMVMESV
jgi:hypothetical protein